MPTEYGRHLRDGPIDIPISSAALAGTPTFTACEQRALAKLAADVGVDDYQPVGLLVRTSGFEIAPGSELSS